MTTPSGNANVPPPVSATRRRRLIGFSLGQLAVGCLMVLIGLPSGSLFLIVCGGFLASWFWIPLSLAARDKPKAKTRLGYGLMAAAMLVAGGMAAAFFLLPDKGYVVMLGVGIVGMLWLVVPVLIAWAMAGGSSAAPQTWGRTGGPRTVAGLGLSVDADSDPEHVTVTIDVGDPRYLGESASLEIYRLADVHDASPVNDLALLASRELVLDRERIDLALPAGAIRGFTYRGKQVSVKTFAELRLADGLVWDTTVCTEVRLPECRLPDPQGDAKRLADPKDAFSLVSNFRAIPLHRKAAVVVLLAAGAVVIACNTALGLRDELAPAGSHFVYSKRDTDGDSRSPLGQSLLLSGATGTAIWFALRRQLRSYTTFRLERLPGTIGRETVLAIDEIVRGRPVVDLEDVTVRVVACNLEKGSYTRGSGSNTRVINFAAPVAAVVLFEQHLPLVHRGQPLEASLSGSVRFGPVFDLLHPPCEVSKTHGLILQWEVQLLHDRFVDHELIAPPCVYPAADFVAAGSAHAEATGV